MLIIQNFTVHANFILYTCAFNILQRRFTPSFTLHVSVWTYELNELTKRIGEDKLINNFDN